LEFGSGLNVIVGDNDAGKTTLLEAVQLALTARIRGRLPEHELSPHLFNQQASRRYVSALHEGKPAPPPEIVIDLYLDDTDDGRAPRDEQLHPRKLRRAPREDLVQSQLRRRIREVHRHPPRRSGPFSPPPPLSRLRAAASSGFRSAVTTPPRWSLRRRFPR
jgi:hypothetical protein